MMDMGPYYITALVNLLGGVKRLGGMVSIPQKQRVAGCKEHFGEVIDVEVPTSYYGVLEFESGVIGSITTSFDVYMAHLPTIEIYGTNGTIRVPDPNGFGGHVWMYTPEGGEREIPLGDHFFDNGPMIFRGLDADTVTLCSDKSGRFLEFGIRGFTDLCLWGVPTRMSIIAVEPWIGTSDRVDTDHVWEHKPGARCVLPGEGDSHTVTFRMG
jgi:predicted dehydrogenase